MIFFSPFLVDVQHWNDIAKFRRFLQRIGNNRLIFIDEIAVYAVMPPLHTLVAPGHEPLIIVEKPSRYAERYDFIGAINGSQAIASMTLTPTDRKNRDIDGVRKEIVNEWIRKKLAPAINPVAEPEKSSRRGSAPKKYSGGGSAPPPAPWLRH
jgi:hypothetical protein